MTAITVDLSTPPTQAQITVVRAVGAALAEQVAGAQTASIPLAVHYSTSDVRVGYGGILWPAIGQSDYPDLSNLAPTDWSARAAEWSDSVKSRCLTVARGGIKPHHAHLPGGVDHTIPDSLTPYMRACPDAVAEAVKTAENYYQQQQRWERLQADLRAMELGDFSGVDSDTSEAHLPADDRMTETDLTTARAQMIDAAAPLLWAGLEAEALDYLWNRAGYNVASAT